MMHTTMIMEDTTLIATVVTEVIPDENGMTHGGCKVKTRWKVSCQDNLTGEHRECEMNFEEFAATIFLMLNNDEDCETTTMMYARCEHLFKDWPNSVRPIP